MLIWPDVIPTIDSDDLRLRPVDVSDIQSIYRACQDPEIQAFTLIPAPYTIEHASYFINSVVREGFDSRAALNFCVEYRKQFAGIVSLQEFEVRNHLARVGYWVTKEMRGKGIASRAVTLTCAYGFRNMGIRRIEGMIFPGNAGSAKVLLRAGFEFEALLKSRITRRNGEQSDSQLYSLIHSSSSIAQ